MRISDWSSDVCSSDLPRAIVGHDDVDTARVAVGVEQHARARLARRSGEAHRIVEQPRDESRQPRCVDRKSVVEGKSVSVRVDLGGRRIIKKKSVTAKLKRIIVYRAKHINSTKKKYTLKK